jgi:hypothetical protein
MTSGEPGMGAPMMGPVDFSDFQIEAPELPIGDDELIALVDEEDSVVVIHDLKRSEVRDMFQSLDSAVKETLRTGDTSRISVQKSNERFDFQISSREDDLVWISGRVFEEGYADGSYFHDFEINGITLEDWEKLKSLVN